MRGGTQMPRLPDTGPGIGIEEMRVALADGVVVIDHGADGSVATNRDASIFVALEPDAAAIAGRFDGTTLGEVARAELASRGRIPFGILVDTARRLAAAGLLADAEVTARALGAESRVEERAHHLVARTSATLWSARGRAAPAGGRARPGFVYAGLGLWAAAAVALVATRGFGPTGTLVPDGASAIGLALFIAAGSTLVTIRHSVVALAARLAGSGPAPIRLVAFYGVVGFDPGARAIDAAPLRTRIGAWCLAIGVDLAVLAAVRGASATLGGTDWLGPVALAAAGFALLDLCPFGAASGARLLEALTRSRGGGGAGLAYLRRRALARSLRGQFFDGEPALIAWISAHIAWTIAVVEVALAAADANFEPVLMAIVEGDGATRIAAAALGLGIGLLVLAASGGFVLIVLVFVGSALGTRRSSPLARPLDPLDTDDVAARLGRIPIFRPIDEAMRERIARSASRVGFGPGDALVRQGEPGHAFYVLLDGDAEVVVEEPSGRERVVARIGPEGTFGETALLDSVPRTATVRGVSSGTALAIEGDAFREIVESGHGDADPVALVRGANLLRQSPMFADLSPDATGRLIAALARRSMSAGEVIVRRGERGEHFFIVLHGTVEVRGEDEPERTDRAEQVRTVLGPGQAFGEIALLVDVPRTATVTAKEDGELLVLDRAAFYDFFWRNLATGARLEALAATRLAEVAR